MELSGKTSSGRRDEITIMTDLMANMFQPMRSTHLLYKTNLSYSQLKKYLTSLLHMGLVVETAKPYRAFSITERGRTFMELVGADAESPRRFLTTTTTARS